MRTLPAALLVASAAVAAAAVAPVTGAAAATRVPRCTDSQIQLATGPRQGAAGSVYQTLVFTNRSRAACSLFGYPGVAGVDRRGHQVVQARRLRAPMASVVLAPHRHAEAVVRGSAVCAAGRRSSVASLLATPANTYRSTPLRVSLPTCHGLTVSPTRPVG